MAKVRQFFARPCLSPITMLTTSGSSWWCGVPWASGLKNLNEQGVKISLSGIGNRVRRVRNMVDPLQAQDAGRIHQDASLLQVLLAVALLLLDDECDADAEDALLWP